MSANLFVQGHKLVELHIVCHVAEVFEAQRPDSVVLTLVPLHSLFESSGNNVIVHFSWKIKD